MAPSNSIPFVVRALHLTALTSFACSAPLFSILKDGPEFFVNRRALPSDIALVAVGLFVVPTLSILALEALAYLLGRRVGDLVHYAAVWLLSAIVAVPLLTSVAGCAGIVAVVVACFLGLGVATCVARFQAARQWLAALVLLSVVSFVSFFFSDGVKTLLFPHKVMEGEGFTKSSDTPVAMLVFDEFPLNGLLDKNLEIDPVRFPHFAQFAKDSIWYRNATAVNAFTPIALPAILSGTMPRTLKQLPTTESYPTNLFTVLARSHSVSAFEPFTRLCPPEICTQTKRPPNRRKRLKAMLMDLAAVYLNFAVPSDLDIGVPSIDGKWGDFWDEKRDSWNAPNFARKSRVNLFKDFLRSIKSSNDKPPFIFAHVILPHMPHQFVPSGKMYFSGPLHGYIKDRWTEDPAFLQAGFGQFMSQLGATDTVVGLFMEKLKQLGIYDKAIVVIAADHGFSVRPASYRRGDIDEDSFYEDIMNVPLMIKFPGKTSGQISPLHAQNNDVLPTILDALGLDYQLPLDGRSLLDSSIPDRQEQQFLVGRVHNPGRRQPKVKKVVKAEGEVLSYKAPAETPRSTVDWKYTLPGYTDPHPSNPYFIGPHSELLGQPVSAFSTSSLPATYEVLSVGDRSKKQDWSRTINFDPKSGTCPCNIQGNVSGGDLKPLDEVALAINGVLRGFAQLIDGPGDIHHFVFLPLDAAFQSGANSVQLYKVESRSSGGIQLKTLRPAEFRG